MTSPAVEAEAFPAGRRSSASDPAHSGSRNVAASDL